MTDDTDEAIWARVTAGEARAFGGIWDRHHARVARHLSASGTPVDDADDLVATVFLELWRRRASVRFVDGSVLPWLLVTARNVARNALRARRRYRRFLATLPDPDPVPDHAERIADGDASRYAHVRAELARARPVDAHLLALTAIEGFTIAEATTALGISESAGKMRLSRLRTRLSSALTTSTIPEEHL